MTTQAPSVIPSDVSDLMWSVRQEDVGKQDATYGPVSDRFRLSAQWTYLYPDCDDRSILVSAMISAQLAEATIQRVAQMVDGRGDRLCLGSLVAVLGTTCIEDDKLPGVAQDLLVAALTEKPGDLAKLLQRKGVSARSIAYAQLALGRLVSALSSAPIAAGRLADAIATSPWGAAYYEEFGSGEFDELLGTRGLLTTPRLTRLRRGLVYSGSLARHVINRWVPFVANRIR